MVQKSDIASGGGTRPHFFCAGRRGAEGSFFVYMGMRRQLRRDTPAPAGLRGGGGSGVHQKLCFFKGVFWGTPSVGYVTFLNQTYLPHPVFWPASGMCTLKMVTPPPHTFFLRWPEGSRGSLFLVRCVCSLRGRHAGAPAGHVQGRGVR